MHRRVIAFIRGQRSSEQFAHGAESAAAVHPYQAHQIVSCRHVFDVAQPSFRVVNGNRLTRLDAPLLAYNRELTSMFVLWVLHRTVRLLLSLLSYNLLTYLDDDLFANQQALVSLFERPPPFAR